MSQIKLNSPEAKVLKECALIICDEATMTPSHALEAVDKLLRELMEVSNKPFGGKVKLLGGDFRQCLPVVKHGHRVAIVQSPVESATTWASFHTLRLTVNMRAQEEQNLWFPEWLIKLGNGELTNSQGFHEEIFEIPPGMILPGHESLIEAIFGERLTPEMEHLYAGRVILCPKNKDCLEINSKVLNALPGNLVTFRSIDTVEEDDPVQVANFPTEFLNSLRNRQRNSLNYSSLIRKLNNWRGFGRESSRKSCFYPTNGFNPHGFRFTISILQTTVSSSSCICSHHK